MIKKVSDYITSHKLIEAGDRILLAVSGGADSVCLLHVLSTLYRDTDVAFFVVHVHHGIRQEEADRDEAFVRALCDSLKIEYKAYYYDVKALAAKEGLSEEEAGRKARYEAFMDASKAYKCNKVAVAHNKNDNAETFLFNLFRGSAVKGLTGMDPNITMKTDMGSIKIIRPLLALDREEIEDYLREHGLSYQNDSTNFKDVYTRNKIRNQVLRYVRDQINSNAIDHINNAADHLREAFDYIEKRINERYPVIVRQGDRYYEYLTNDLEQEDIVIRKGIVRRILGSLAGSLKDIEAKHVDAVLAFSNKQVGKMLHLPYGILALKKYDAVKVYLEDEDTEQALSRQEPASATEITIPGRTDIRQYGIFIETEVFENKKSRPIPKNSCMKWFDYDKIENTLKLRVRESGDYLQIDSKGGRKRLKNYFIDLKVPREERDRVPLLADGSHILWIVGYGNRISEAYKISDSTKRILSIKITYAKEKDNDR